MKPTPNPEVEPYRDLAFSNPKDGNNGLFSIPMRTSAENLRVVVSDGMGWDHVSASVPGRCPYWEEMMRLRQLFFSPGETVLMFHFPDSVPVSDQKNVLHLWRPQNFDLKQILPPDALIGQMGIRKDQRTWMPVESSNIANIGFSDATNTLFIRFKSGGVYAYKNFPRVMWDEFVLAESKGKYFHAKIKNNYLCEKVED